MAGPTTWGEGTGDVPCIPKTASEEDCIKPISSATPLTHARWTHGRAITALRWLPAEPNVLFASYSRNNQHYTTLPSATEVIDANGVVAAWDVERSELRRTFLHTAPLDALVAPHPLSPTMLLSGSANGDIVAWDTRSRTTSPVLRSHSASVSPVRALEGAGASSPYVISAAADGTISAWSLSQLSTPIESTVVRERGLRDVKIGAMSIPASAAFQRTPGTEALGKRAAVMVGGMDGGVYSVENAAELWTTRHAGSRHDSPVTSICCHPGASRFPQLGDLAATASIDGSVGVWSFGRRGAGLRLLRLGSRVSTPTTDVQWSPTHPGLFVACDAAGGVSTFDLTRADDDMCLGRHSASTGQGAPPCPLNRLQWNGDGSILASGSVDGAINLWRASDSIRSPSGSTWEAVSASAKQWRAREATALGSASELPVPSSYVFRAIPPVFNPLAS